MVNRWTAAALICLVAGTGCHRSPPATPKQPPPPPQETAVPPAPAPPAVIVSTARITHTAQTPDGTVWTADRNLMKWENGGWKKIVELPKSQAVALMHAMQDGTVWIAFRLEEVNGKMPALPLYRWVPKEERLEPLGTLPDGFCNSSWGDLSFLHEDAAGHIWLTGADPRVFRWESGKWTEAFKATPAMLWKDPAGTGMSDEWNPLRIFETPDGAVWLWSDTFSGGSNHRSLQGLVRLDGPEPRHFKEIPGVPPGPFFYAGPALGGGFWVSIFKQGVFHVAPALDAAEKTDVPDENGDQPVSELFIESGEAWALVGSWWRPPKDRESYGGVLWRRGADGVWKPVIRGLDGTNFSNSVRFHSWIRTKEGLWIGSAGKGAWLVPADGSPARGFNWLNGFASSMVEAIYLMPPAGNLGLFAFDNNQTVFNPETLALRPAEGNGCGSWPFRGSVTQTQDGSIFALFEQSKWVTLCEWSGSEWTTIPFPDGIKPSSTLQLGADSLNRLWLIPNEPGATACVFDLATRSWLKPRPYQDWIAQAAPHPSFYFLFNSFDPDRSREAVFGSDGKAVFLVHNRNLSYFNGKEWKTLEPANLANFTGGSMFQSIRSEPKTGRILVRVDNRYWRHPEPNDTWETSSPDLKPLGSPYGELDPNWNTPPGWDKSTPSLAVTTAPDEIWVSHNSQLWRIRNQIVAPWFKEGTNHPFLEKGILTHVMTDKHGNYLMHVSAPFEHRLVQVPRHLGPTPKLTIETPAPDRALLKLAANDQNPWVRWRIAPAGDWTPWKQGALFELGLFSPGDYPVRIEFMTTDLRDLVPVDATLKIRYRQEDLVATAAQNLFGGDWSLRNSAVVTLSRFPDLAKAELKKINRPGLYDTDRWWLESAEEAVARAATPQPATEKDTDR